MGCSCSKVAPTTSDRQDIRDEYRIGRLLGSGAFGQVRECTRRTNGQLLAVKIMERKSRESGHWSNENMFRREVQLLGLLDHSHIVRYVDFYEDHHFLYAVIEHCDGGELFEQIIKSKRFSEDDASYICRQMLLALAHVHSIGIVHRDIKAENFLFKEKNIDSELKLIDFGMSAKLPVKNSFLTEVCGSPHYLSPEVVNVLYVCLLSRRQYNTKADVWAIGVVIYLMIYGRYPFDASATEAILEQVVKKPIDFNAGSVTPSVTCVDFLKKLLDRNPNLRYSADDALKHKWVEDTEEHRIRRQRAAADDISTDLIECVRSAQKKVTSTRKSGLSKEAEARLNQILKEAERDWGKGKAYCVRVSPSNMFPQIKRDFSRHHRRIGTTPSHCLRSSLADIQAWRLVDISTTESLNGRCNNDDSRLSGSEEFEDEKQSKLFDTIQTVQLDV